MEEWEIKRRAELEEEIPQGFCINLKSDRFNLWTGRLGAIEYQITMEKEVKKMFNKPPLT